MWRRSRTHDPPVESHRLNQGATTPHKAIESIYSFIHQPIYSLTIQLSHESINPSIYSSIHPSIHPLIYTSIETHPHQPIIPFKSFILRLQSIRQPFTIKPFCYCYYYYRPIFCHGVLSSSGLRFYNSIIIIICFPVVLISPRDLTIAFCHGTNFIMRWRSALMSEKTRLLKDPTQYLYCRGSKAL